MKFSTFINGTDKLNHQDLLQTGGSLGIKPSSLVFHLLHYKGFYYAILQNKIQKFGEIILGIHILFSKYIIYPSMYMCVCVCVSMNVYVCTVDKYFLYIFMKGKMRIWNMCIKNST